MLWHRLQRTTTKGSIGRLLFDLKRWLETPLYQKQWDRVLRASNIQEPTPLRYHHPVKVELLSWICASCNLRLLFVCRSFPLCAFTLLATNLGSSGCRRFIVVAATALAYLSSGMKVWRHRKTSAKNKDWDEDPNTACRWFYIFMCVSIAVFVGGWPQPWLKWSSIVSRIEPPVITKQQQSLLWLCWINFCNFAMKVVSDIDQHYLTQIKLSLSQLNQKSLTTQPRLGSFQSISGCWLTCWLWPGSQNYIISGQLFLLSVVVQKWMQT